VINKFIYIISACAFRSTQAYITLRRRRPTTNINSLIVCLLAGPYSATLSTLANWFGWLFQSSS